MSGKGSGRKKGWEIEKIGRGRKAKIWGWDALSPQVSCGFPAVLN